MLRYGENPHQQAALYADAGAAGANVVAAQQLHGKELSYNNLLDLDSALAIVRDFAEPAAVVIKHNNPCGAAVADTPGRRPPPGHGRRSPQRLRLRAGAEPPRGRRHGRSAGRAGPVRRGHRRPRLRARGPGNPHHAAQVEGQRAADEGRPARAAARRTGPIRRLDGGMLRAGGRRAAPIRKSSGRSVTEARPRAAQMADLRFAWAMVRHVKSNAIVLAKDRMLLGTGAGQMSRVDSVEIAVKKAGDRAARLGDGLRRLLPLPRFDRGGRRGRRDGRDPARRLAQRRQVIAACNRHGLPMIFTGRRHSNIGTRTEG